MPLTGDVTYPCSSNLADFKCVFEEGERFTYQKANLTTLAGIASEMDYYFDYDHVHIIFSEQSNMTAGWHVVVPTLLIIDD